MTVLARASEWTRPSAAPSRTAKAPLPAQHYFAFLSYSHADAADADWLHRELEQFRVPSSLAGRLTDTGVIPKRLTPVFRDRHELAAADDLGEEIRDALALSRSLIVLCSPSAARSKWTNAEIEAFKKAHPEGCVIAAILSGEPFASGIPGREHEECLPPALRQKYDRRGRPTGRHAEPLAADLREGHGGRRLGFLKIVAGMLGLGLDDLVQRDQLRRQRRLAGIAAGSLVGMIIAIALALTAISARDAARDQRREAEGLVAFMLGDLKDKLEPIGRLDALDGVGARVLAYYSKQDTSELSDSGLVQRSRALSLTAQVAYLRGNLQEARRLYSEAKTGTAEAVERDPDDPQRLYDHAQNVFWIGEIDRLRGNFTQAEAAFRDYKRLGERMVAIEPQNLRWRMESLYGDENLGIVLRNQRRFAEAAWQFHRALAPMESLASIEPGNSGYQKELSNLLAWLADAESDQGHLDASLAVRQRQVSFLHRLLADRNSDLRLLAQLIPAHQALGLLLSSRGELEGAIEQFRLAVAQAKRVNEIEPTNTYWLLPAASARIELAKTLLALDRRDSAALELRAGCALVARIRALGPDLARSRTLQTMCLAMQARLALASGATAEALLLAERTVKSARAQSSGDMAADRYGVAAAHRLLGDVHSRIGDREAARAAWTSGLAQLPAGVAERPWEKNERAGLLERLGRTDEAHKLAGQLAAIGYRSVT